MMETSQTGLFNADIIGLACQVRYTDDNIGATSMKYNQVLVFSKVIITSLYFRLTA